MQILISIISEICVPLKNLIHYNHSILKKNLFIKTLIISQLLVNTLRSNVPKDTLGINEIDVIKYEIQLKLPMINNLIVGEEWIHFKINPMATQAVFDCGRLEIISVEGKIIKSFTQKDRKLYLNFSEHKNENNTIKISYKGSPKRGIQFLKGPTQAYTVYFTQEWMVCNFKPKDRASLETELIVPNQYTCVASGELLEKQAIQGNMLQYSWKLSTPSPAYTYGFAIGQFNESQKTYKDASLHFYAHNYSSRQLDSIFRYSTDMLSFFEEKSGIPYFQKSYSQILIGNHFQEMAGFAVLRNSYGNLILKDSTETNLITHEMAHQWWGNLITCETFRHFWLNEGFATYMSAAYNEHRFGKEKYEEQIQAYYDVYQKIKEQGLDKSLVFEDWINPTREDRNLVYFKGAYVLHLLREKLGDEIFWQGIKDYSIQYFGKSVTTGDFQMAMEKSSGIDLSDFFKKWIY